MVYFWHWGPFGHENIIMAPLTDHTGIEHILRIQMLSLVENLNIGNETLPF